MYLFVNHLIPAETLSNLAGVIEWGGFASEALEVARVIQRRGACQHI